LEAPQEVLHQIEKFGIITHLPLVTHIPLQEKEKVNKLITHMLLPSELKMRKILKDTIFGTVLRTNT